MVRTPKPVSGLQREEHARLGKHLRANGAALRVRRRTRGAPAAPCRRHVVQVASMAEEGDEASTGSGSAASGKSADEVVGSWRGGGKREVGAVMAGSWRGDGEPLGV